MHAFENESQISRYLTPSMPTERNIENHRYRLRKKMKLKKEDDLGQLLAKM